MLPSFTAEVVHWLSLVLWIAVIGVIITGVVHGLLILLLDGVNGIPLARQRVGSAVISGLGLSTAIALLSTTQLRSWTAIAIFAATAGLRMLVKAFERFSLRHTT